MPRRLYQFFRELFCWHDYRRCWPRYDPTGDDHDDYYFCCRRCGKLT